VKKLLENPVYQGGQKNFLYFHRNVKKHKQAAFYAFKNEENIPLPSLPRLTPGSQNRIKFHQNAG